MAGPIRTPAELALRVATSMNLLRPGEDLPVSMQSQIEQAYEEQYAELLEDRLAYWPQEEIPLAVFQRVAWLVAIQVAPAFGALPVLLLALATPDADVGRDTIRRWLRDHVSKDATYETLRGEFL